MSFDILYEHAGDDDGWLEDVALVSSMPALEPDFEASFSRGVSLISPLALLLMGTLASVGVSGLMTSRIHHGNAKVGLADTLLLNAEPTSISDETMASLLSRSKPGSPPAPIPIPTPSRQSREAGEGSNAVVIVDGTPTTAAASVAPEGAAESISPVLPRDRPPARPNPPVLRLE